MIIGIPKEIKPSENRVGITPAGVNVLVNAGHKVIVQNDAGIGSGIYNEDYKKAGASIKNSAQEIYDIADMILKVKEPLPAEYGLMRKDQLLFTYLHLAAEPELTRVLMEKGVIAIAYETVQDDDGLLPLLAPMSEVAGRMAVQIGAGLLDKTQIDGRGVLLGGVPGVAPAEVVIIGAGIVGINAAKIAIGLGARVTIIDVNIKRLRYLDDIYHNRITTQASNAYEIARAVKKADLLIGAVLIPGQKAPKLVTEEMVKEMKQGAVIIDIAVDQGGCVETIDRITTHKEPVYIKYGVIHYAVPNVPGVVPRTSTLALTNVTIPFALELANKGYREVLAERGPLAKGFNVMNGRIVHPGVALAHSIPYIEAS